MLDAGLKGELQKAVVLVRTPINPHTPPSTPRRFAGLRAGLDYSAPTALTFIASDALDKAKGEVRNRP